MQNKSCSTWNTVNTAVKMESTIEQIALQNCDIQAALLTLFKDQADYEEHCPSQATDSSVGKGVDICTKNYLYTESVSCMHQYFPYINAVPNLTSNRA